jgi:hypothetical protein
LTYTAKKQKQKYKGSTVKTFKVVKHGPQAETQTKIQSFKRNNNKRGIYGKRRIGQNAYSHHNNLLIVKERLIS